MDNKQNKNTLIDEIAAETGLTKKDVKNVINLFIKKIKQALLNGHKVLLKGFVTFMLRDAKPRKVNDFNNEGAKISVGPRRLPKARFSDTFIKQVKKK